MALLNVEQRKFVQGKMNTFLLMENFKPTLAQAADLLKKIYLKKKFSVKPRYVSFKHGSLESNQTSLSFDALCIPVPPEVKKIQDKIRKEKARRSAIVKSIQEKIIFGAQAEEMKQLLALLK